MEFKEGIMFYLGVNLIWNIYDIGINEIICEFEVRNGYYYLGILEILMRIW